MSTEVGRNGERHLEAERKCPEAVVGSQLRQRTDPGLGDLDGAWPSAVTSTGPMKEQEPRKDDRTSGKWTRDHRSFLQEITL